MGTINKTKQDALTHDRLLSLLEYNAESGTFRHTKRSGVRTYVEAGTVKNNGYRAIRVDMILYHAHRLAWFYVHGVWPTDEIDHINGDKTNNSIENLREVTHAENMTYHYELKPRPSYVKRRRRPLRKAVDNL